MGRAQNEILSLLAQCMFHRERIIKLFAEKPLVVMVSIDQQLKGIVITCQSLPNQETVWDFFPV